MLVGQPVTLSLSTRKIHGIQIVIAVIHYDDGRMSEHRFHSLFGLLTFVDERRELRHLRPFVLAEAKQLGIQ